MSRRERAVGVRDQDRIGSSPSAGRVGQAETYKVRRVRKAVKAIDCLIKSSKSVHIPRSTIAQGPRGESCAAVCRDKSANCPRSRVHIDSNTRAVSK